MKKLIFNYFILFPIFLFGQKDEDNNIEKMLEIETKDGNIFLGIVVEENEEYYKLKTKDGILVEIPLISVQNTEILTTKNVDGKVLRADPNKSLYLFAPSAFPIEKGKSYCRDFCVFFPSYNRGFGNNFSLQLGAFVFGAVNLDQIPLVISGKFSLPKTTSIGILNTSFALGGMYVQIPFEFFDEDIGLGIAFGTVTLGNNFNHFSTSIGWGYTRYSGDWELDDDPLINIAGNFRFTNSFALIGEQWFIPDLDLDDSPLILSTRFIGRKFAVDFGGIMTLENIVEGILPFPIINFTYHPR